MMMVRRKKFPNGRMPRVAICFFGIARSLSYTRQSILDKVIEPIESFADVQIYSHLFHQERIENPRSGEEGFLPDDVQIHRKQILIREQPEGCLDLWGLEKLKRHGDYWGDGFRSLRNLVCQLHSLREVTRLSYDFNADCTVFVRPDLWYYDDLGPSVSLALASQSDHILLPTWQSFRGENDRFAVVVGKGATASYGERITRAHVFCDYSSGPLHSERLVKFAIEGFPLTRITARAARVRFDGRVVSESFNASWIDDLHEKLHFSGLHAQVRRVGHFALNQSQRLYSLTTGQQPIPKSDSGELLLAYPRENEQLQ